jgi:ATP-dependent helicase HrpA
VRAGDFQLDKLPNHLRMNIQVVDDQGQVQRMGRDLEQLQRSARWPESTDEGDADRDEQPWLRDGITCWDFDSLPVDIRLVRGGIEVAAYPALIDRGTAVDLRLLDIQATADQMSRRGVARLYALAQRKSIETQVRWLPRWDEICVWAAAAISPASLKDDVTLRIAELAFLEPEGLPRDQREFHRRLEKSGERIGDAVQQLAPLLPRLFAAYQQARAASESLVGPRDAEARADVLAQLQSLLAPGFVADVPWNWLQQYPRYLQGIVYRIDRLRSGSQARDEEARQTIAGFWQRYVRQQQANDQRQRFDPQLVEFRWMIEELRVSLLAQPLGTAIKISPQRLERQWEKVQTS